jgi:hypothetical protein
LSYKFLFIFLGLRLPADRVWMSAMSRLEQDSIYGTLFLKPVEIEAPPLFAPRSGASSADDEMMKSLDAMEESTDRSTLDEIIARRSQTAH